MPFQLLRYLAHNPWCIVSAVAFSASNEPQAVPELFKYVLAEVGEEHEQRLLLARKFRDALFKAGLTSGYSKVRNESSSFLVQVVFIDL